MAAEVCGCDSWALTTTGQPAASAEAVSPPATENANGKLDAANTATGPMGLTMRRSPGTPVAAGLVIGVGIAAVGQHIAEHPQLAGGAGHLAGQPGAAQGGLGVGQRARSAAWASSASATAARAARPAGPSRSQPSAAAAAAATAMSTALSAVS